MSLSLKLILAVALIALGACSPLLPTKERGNKAAVVSAPGGKKVDYTYALNGIRKFSYTVRLVRPDSTSEWAPAVWLILDHKGSAPAYPFMLFQDSDGSVRPEIRLLDQAEGRERKSVEPDLQLSATDKILVGIELKGSHVISSINGQVVEITELGFPIDQLRIGFSSGTFSIEGGLPGVPEVGG